MPLTVSPDPEPRETSKAAPAEPILDIRRLSFAYRGANGLDALQALKNIDLHVSAGEFVSLIGPSGCGKSSLLRLAADLLPPTSGQIMVCGHSPRRARLARRLGMVFQDPALLEWRSVIDNVALPLELMGWSQAKRYEPAQGLVETVGLAGFEKVHPCALSGGMRQRVALARAMVAGPSVLYMDEPFGALDQITRERLNLELLRIVERDRATVLFVTHSIREAVLLSDRIAIMSPRPGRILDILQVDLPRPRTVDLRLTKAYEALVREGTRCLEEGMAGNG